VLSRFFVAALGGILMFLSGDDDKLQCIVAFVDNVTPVNPKNSCKLVGKSLINFF